MTTDPGRPRRDADRRRRPPPRPARRPRHAAWLAGRTRPRAASAASAPSWPASPPGARPPRPASATAASPIQPGSRPGCTGGSCRPTSRVGETVDGLIDDAQLDWRAERQARFAAGNVLDALAPIELPVANPAVVKAIVDEGGLNLVRGARHFAGDFPHLPSTVDTSTVRGRREPRASRPGTVVLRTEVFELIQYTPQTEQVREIAAAVRRRRRSTSTTCSTSRRAAAWSSTSSARASRSSPSPGATRTPSRATSTSTRTRPRSSRRATRSPSSPAARRCTSTRACSGGILTAGAARPPGRRGPARRDREP